MLNFTVDAFTISRNSSIFDPLNEDIRLVHIKKAACHLFFLYVTVYRYCGSC